MSSRFLSPSPERVLSRPAPHPPSGCDHDQPQHNPHGTAGSRVDAPGCPSGSPPEPACCPGLNAAATLVPAASPGAGEGTATFPDGHRSERYFLGPQPQHLCGTQALDPGHSGRAVYPQPDQSPGPWLSELAQPCQAHCPLAGTRPALKHCAEGVRTSRTLPSALEHPVRRPGESRLREQGALLH